MFANRDVGGYTIPSVVFYLVAVFFIIIYGYFLRRSGRKDILAKDLYHHPVCQHIDGWSLTHFFFFGALGWFFPGQHLQFFLVGAGWEVIETVLGQHQLEVSGKRLQLVGDQDGDGNLTGNDCAYWYGKESDIIMDVAGYSIGSALADRYWPNTKKTKPRSR